MYENKAPGEYVVHIRFTALDDTNALDLADALVTGAERLDLPADVLTGEYYVTDADDWAEHVTQTCEGLTGAPVAHGGPLTRIGIGRRVCSLHAEDYAAR